MYGLRVVFVLVIAVHLASSIGDHITTIEHFELYRNHMSRLKHENFPCEMPQRRELSLREIVIGDEFEKFAPKIDQITPSGSVLHRCQNAGCCGKYDEECRAQSENIVELAFMIISKPIPQFFTVKAINHTSCACRKISP